MLQEVATGGDKTEGDGICAVEDVGGERETGLTEEVDGIGTSRWKGESGGNARGYEGEGGQEVISSWTAISASPSGKDAVLFSSVWPSVTLSVSTVSLPCVSLLNNCEGPVFLMSMWLGV